MAKKRDAAETAADTLLELAKRDPAAALEAVTRTFDAVEKAAIRRALELSKGSESAAVRLLFPKLENPLKRRPWLNLAIRSTGRHPDLGPVAAKLRSDNGLTKGRKPTA